MTTAVPYSCRHLSVLHSSVCQSLPSYLSSRWDHTTNAHLRTSPTRAGFPAAPHVVILVYSRKRKSAAPAEKHVRGPWSSTPHSGHVSMDGGRRRGRERDGSELEVGRLDRRLQPLQVRVVLVLEEASAHLRQVSGRRARERDHTHTERRASAGAQANSCRPRAVACAPRP